MLLASHEPRSLSVRREPSFSETVVVKQSPATLSAASHPLAGKQMSGAEIIVQVLADEGVETVFGYSGGAILPTYGAIFVYNRDGAVDGRQPMPLVVPANE